MKTSKSNRYVFGILKVFIILAILSCKGMQSVPENEIPSMQAEQHDVQVSSVAPAAPLWLGDGGKEMSLGILIPESQGLNENQKYIPTVIQGCLVANFSKYSAISVLDRVSLDKVIEETMDPTYQDDFDIVRLGHVAHVDYILSGKVVRTSTNYTLQLNVTDTSSNARTIASYSDTCTVAQVDNQTAIQRASQDLLTQMGVELTDRAKTELGTENPTQSINAQTALAHGIMAQRKGTEVAALSYFFQAAALDPALPEAQERSAILAASISSGNIGEDARNDVQWRKNWIARLTETEQYFNDYFDSLFKSTPLPYTLDYTVNVQAGNINYQNETVTLTGIDTLLSISDDWVQSITSVFRSMRLSIQTVYDGLNSTGRKTRWGLGNWPMGGNFNLQHFGKHNITFSVTVELVNSREQVIGSQTFETVGRYEYPIPLPGKPIRDPHFGIDSKKVNFSGVNVNDITDNLNIRIARVNGIAAETAAKNGLLQINLLTTFDSIPITLDLIYFSVHGDIIYDYFGPYTNIKIPYGITSIGEYAFGRNQLTSVIIPNSVISIGKYAFRCNQLTSIIIPNSVTHISPGAFADNQLTSVIIPNNVRYIAYDAFRGNNLITDITIGANINLGYGKIPSFSQSFDNFYKRNGRKAGRYTFNGTRWNYSGR